MWLVTDIRDSHSIEMYILLQNTISNIITKQYVQFQNQCGNITFFKIKNMQLCRWHLTQIWDLEKCECLSFFFQITDFCWAMHRFPCQNTNFPTFPEHICWKLCMAQPRNLFENKNALTFSRISYFSMCHLHSCMFLLLKIWCSQLVFGNEHVLFWEGD